MKIAKIKCVSRSFLIHTTITTVTSAEQRNPILLYWCTSGITLPPVIVT